MPIFALLSAALLPIGLATASIAVLISPYERLVQDPSIKKKQLANEPCDNVVEMIKQNIGDDYDISAEAITPPTLNDWYIREYVPNGATGKLIEISNQNYSELNRFQSLLSNIFWNRTIPHSINLINDVVTGSGSDQDKQDFKTIMKVCKSVFIYFPQDVACINIIPAQSEESALSERQFILERRPLLGEASSSRRSK